MIRRPPRSTLDRSSAASDVYKRQPEWMAQGIDADTGRIDTHGSVGVSVYASASGDVTSVSFDNLSTVAVESDPSEIRPSYSCLLYTSPSPRDRTRSRMPSSA